MGQCSRHGDNLVWLRRAGVDVVGITEVVGDVRQFPIGAGIPMVMTSASGAAMARRLLFANGLAQGCLAIYSAFG